MKLVLFVLFTMPMLYTNLYAEAIERENCMIEAISIDSNSECLAPFPNKAFENSSLTSKIVLPNYTLPINITRSGSGNISNSTPNMPNIPPVVPTPVVPGNNGGGLGNGNSGIHFNHSGGGDGTNPGGHGNVNGFNNPNNKP